MGSLIDVGRHERYIAVASKSAAKSPTAAGTTRIKADINAHGNHAKRAAGARMMRVQSIVAPLIGMS